MRDEIAIVGILVHGDNHFIVSGPLPDREIAIALVRQWSLIQIGAATSPSFDRWHIVSREFRENLKWAVVIPGEGTMSAAVRVLLEEMSARESPFMRPSSSLGDRSDMPLMGGAFRAQSLFSQSMAFRKARRGRSQ